MAIADKNVSNKATTTCFAKRGAVLISGLGIFSMIGYALLLKILLQKRLHKKLRFVILILPLAADSTYSLITMIVTVTLANTSAGLVCTGAQLIINFFIGSVFMLSCLFSVGLSINQYIAITYTLRYKAIVTKKRVKTVSGICIVSSIFVNILSFIDKKTYTIQNATVSRFSVFNRAILLTSCVTIMTGFLVYSGHVSNTQFRRMSTTVRKSPFWIRRKRIRNEVTIVTSVVIASLVPHGFLCLKVLVTKNIDTQFNYYLMYGSIISLTLFCMFNPYLYLFTLHELRKEVGKLMNNLVCCVYCQKEPLMQQRVPSNVASTIHQIQPMPVQQPVPINTESPNDNQDTQKDTRAKFTIDGNIEERKHLVIKQVVSQMFHHLLNYDHIKEMLSQ